MENGEEEELTGDQKEALIEKVGAKLKRLFSGHSDLIASFGETISSDIGEQKYTCSTVEGLSGSIVRFVEKGEIMSLPGDASYHTVPSDKLYKNDLATFHGIHVECIKRGSKIENICHTTRSGKFIFLYCSAIIKTVANRKPIFFNRKQYEASLEYLMDVKAYAHKLKELKE